jgi:mannose-6-phosphate isomerase-like protein (cupin superfamily)
VRLSPLRTTSRGLEALVAQRGFATGSLDELGDGVFRKVRRALGVTAFGVNAMVLPPRTEWFAHFHERQDELYFVHRGRAGFEIDGRVIELGPGGLCHVESTTPRLFWNAGDEDLVLLIVGGKGGYVERDGQLVDPAEEPRRRAVGAGDLSALRRRDQAS